MLKKSQRINLSQDFKRIASVGKRIHSPHFSIFILKNELNSPPLVGIALAKKEFRRSHQRNRARRLMSEAVFRNYDRLSKGMELVIMPKAGVLQSSAEELTNEFSTISYLY